MEYDYLYNLKTRGQQEQFKSRFASDFTSRYRRAYLEEYQDYLLRSIHTPPHRLNCLKFNFQKPILSTKNSILKLSYNQDSGFLKFNANKTFAASPSYKPQKKLSIDSPLGEKYLQRSSILNETLEDTINIGTLNKATNAVRNNGLNNLPTAYSRKLRYFCKEVIRQMDN